MYADSRLLTRHVRRLGDARAGRGVAVEEPRRLGGARTARAGISSTGPSVIAAATASALPSPLARNQTCSARRRAGTVRETRSGGGLGESCTATAIWSSTASSGRPGNSEAMWPSGPMPSMRTSNDAGAVLAHRAGVGRRGGLRVVDLVGRRHLEDLGGADGVEEGSPGLAGVAVGGAGGHEPLVAEPHHHPGPVDLGARGTVAPARGARPRRCCRRSARSGAPPRPPGGRPAATAARRRPRWPASPHRAAPRRGARSPGPRSSEHRPQRVEVARSAEVDP